MAAGIGRGQKRGGSGGPAAEGWIWIGRAAVWNDLTSAICFFSMVALSVVLVAVPEVFFGGDLHAFNGAADIVQAVATVAAIVIVGVFAWRNLWWLRTFQPHITITHSVSHRPVGTQYIHLAVVATLYNSSRVKVEIQEGVFQLAQVSPIEDDQLLSMYRSAFPLSNERKRWEHKRHRNGDLKGRRIGRPFEGIVPREFGPKPWEPGEPPGGGIRDGQNPPGPATNSPSRDSGAQSQESSTSSE